MTQQSEILGIQIKSKRKQTIQDDAWLLARCINSVNFQFERERMLKPELLIIFTGFLILIFYAVVGWHLTSCGSQLQRDENNFYS